MLPGGMPSLKDVKSDKLDSFPLSMGPEERRACPWCTKQCLWHICQVDYTAYTADRQCYRWIIVVFARNCPLLPELTSSKHSRIHCSWSLIAILCPGCPKLLCHALWCIHGPLNLSNIIHEQIQHGAGSSASPP